MIFGGWAMPEYELRWINLAIYFALTIVGQVWVVRLCMNLRRLAAGRRSAYASRTICTICWATHFPESR